VNFRIGGPARWFFEAKTSEEVAEVIKAAHADGLKWAVLGGGSNTLPSDEGFEGLVIQMANRHWTIDGEMVAAEAGVLSAFLSRKTCEAGFSGLEWAITLPGTIGGAVRGNAGCFGGEMKDILESVEALKFDDGLPYVVVYDKKECKFGYRDSVFKRNGLVVLTAVFRLTPDTPQGCAKRLEQNLAKRKKEQPSDAPSAGCMFKNFEYGNDDTVAKLAWKLNVPKPFLKHRRIPAGWLIDQVGMKGAKIGGAMVSEKHGNFLVNTGKATASDVIQLISMVKMKVRNEYGIQLEEEVQLLGF
jgi:UDP-N-acetylmuramate dehydrogenase